MQVLLYTYVWYTDMIVFVLTKCSSRKLLLNHICLVDPYANKTKSSVGVQLRKASKKGKIAKKKNLI